jgi:hypothetical protein
MKRKPAVYLLVFLPIMVGGGVSLMIALVDAYSCVTGVAKSAVPNLNGLLITLPAFFLWIPTSLLIANFALYCARPLRRIAEAYVERAERPGFEDSQKTLLRVLGVIALVCLPLIALGFAL